MFLKELARLHGPTKMINWSYTAWYVPRLTKEV